MVMIALHRAQNGSTIALLAARLGWVSQLR
jgi:hypothetical protein